MEGKVFPRPAVADLMNEELVEARLHTDVQSTLSEEQFARNRQLQTELAGTKANPYFVIVDPDTGEALASGGLTGSWNEWPDLWVAFVEGAVAAKQRAPGGSNGGNR
jgi:hypothetical protein